MVSKLDESVGRVMQALDEKRILDHAIVVFASDNGAPTIGIHRNHGSNWPLRGVRTREATNHLEKLIVAQLFENFPTCFWN
jgi:arylsulfatase A-like enzyme